MQIDESLLSGESLPLAKAPRDAVTGGSINGDGRIAVKTRAVGVARRTTRKIRQNLFWAFIYNAAGLPLAALGWMNPVVAGLATALSSLSVIGNAALLARWRADDAANDPN